MQINKLWRERLSPQTWGSSVQEARCIAHTILPSVDKLSVTATSGREKGRSAHTGDLRAG